MRIVWPTRYENRDGYHTLTLRHQKRDREPGEHLGAMIGGYEGPQGVLEGYLKHSSAWELDIVFELCTGKQQRLAAPSSGVLDCHRGARSPQERRAIMQYVEHASSRIGKIR